jgi:hypothetical protein
MEGACYIGRNEDLYFCFNCPGSGIKFFKLLKELYQGNRYQATISVAM